MNNFDWELNKIRIDSNLVERLKKSLSADETVVRIHENLRKFRSIIDNCTGRDIDRFIVCKSSVTIYMHSFKKYIEAHNNPKVKEIINIIKRSVLAITNLLTNVGYQIQKCFAVLRELLFELELINNYFLMDYCIVVILDELLNMFESSHNQNAKDLTWGVANFIAIILFNHYKAYVLYIGLISKKCMFTIPIFVNVPISMSREEFCNVVGVYNDEFNCCNYSRIEAYLRLHLSVYISTNDAYSIWLYIAETVNSAQYRKKPIYFCLIFTWLDVCTCYAVYTFGHHFAKLLNTLKFDLMPLLESNLKFLNLDPRSLSIINYYIKKIYMEFLNNRYIKDLLPEGVIIPDERLLTMDNRHG